MKPYEQKLYHILRIVLAIVFIYASIDKIIHPKDFALAVFNHQVLPDALVNLAAIFLPWMELVLGLCLLGNFWMNGASLSAAVLMFIFMGVVTFNLMRGLDVGCGCFSTSSEEGMSFLTVLRDFLLLGMAVSLAAAQSKPKERTPFWQ